MRGYFIGKKWQRERGMNPAPQRRDEVLISSPCCSRCACSCCCHATHTLRGVVRMRVCAGGLGAGQACVVRRDKKIDDIKLRNINLRKLRVSLINTVISRDRAEIFRVTEMYHNPLVLKGYSGVAPSTQMHLPVHTAECKASRVSPRSPGCAAGGASGTCGRELVFDKVARCSQRVRQDCATRSPHARVLVGCLQPVQRSCVSSLRRV